MANFLAQPEALMRGKTREEVEAEFKDSKLPKEQIDRIIPHKVFLYINV